MKIFLSAIAFVIFLSGCQTMSPNEHRARMSEDMNKLTVGTVQSKIKTGMPGSEVATIMGSPNVVSTDEEGREVWIYDKIFREAAVSASGHTFFGSSIGGVSTETQKTLTVVIKFDNDKKVRDIAYHSSSF